MSDQLFTSALGAVTDSMVVTFDDDKRRDYHEKLLLGALHRLTLQRTVAPYVPKPEPNGLATDKASAAVVESGNFIYLKTPTGTVIALTFAPDERIEELKTRIHDRTGISEYLQRLVFAGKQLVDAKTLSDCQIQPESTIYCFLALRGGGLLQYYISDDFRDKRFDYDFTNISDKETFVRGDHEYKRPCGWDRMAVNVNVYGADVTWLGTTRKTRNDSAPGEWPVSYHGTGEHHAKSIAQNGYDLSKGKRFLYGAGIYSTPDINVAALYAKRFRLEDKEYMAVVQNRVNPTTVKKITHQVNGVGEYWLTEKEEDTRAYGICIKQVKK